MKIDKGNPQRELREYLKYFGEVFVVASPTGSAEAVRATRASDAGRRDATLHFISYNEARKLTVLTARNGAHRKPRPCWLSPYRFVNLRNGRDSAGRNTPDRIARIKANRAKRAFVAQLFYLHATAPR